MFRQENFHCETLDGKFSTKNKWAQTTNQIHQVIGKRLHNGQSKFNQLGNACPIDKKEILLFHKEQSCQTKHFYDV